jgi:hypothetical protein
MNTLERLEQLLGKAHVEAHAAVAHEVASPAVGMGVADRRSRFVSAALTALSSSCSRRRAAAARVARHAHVTLNG